MELRRFGRVVVILLGGAALTAIGIFLTTLDVIDILSGPRRRYYIAGLFVVFVACVAGVIYDLMKKVDGLEAQLGAASVSAPCIRFQRVGGPTAVKLDVRSKEIWQLWFVNDPLTRSSAAVAQRLTAEVELFAPDGSRPFDPFVGQWAITQKADHVGWQKPGETTPHENIKNEIDLALKPARGKLMLLATASSHAFALAGENIHAKPGHFEHSKFKVPPSVTRVLVRLAAENMAEQEFSFSISRDGDGRVVAITEIMPSAFHRTSLPPAPIA